MNSQPMLHIHLDRRGRLTGDTDLDEIVASLAARGTTDLMLFAHGWRNEVDAARELYGRFFRQCSMLTDAFGTRPGAVVQHAGVFWPATRWILHGGAASLSPRPDAGLESATASLFDEPDETDEIQRVLQLLHDQPEHDEKLQEFVDRVRYLASGELSPDSDSDRTPDEDALEVEALFVDDWRELLETLAVQEPAPPDEGAAAAANLFGRLWRGARGVFRLLGYWTMKRRAGIIGQDGLGPLLTSLAGRNPALRVHLIGHSFGARLVSYALKGLPDTTTGESSPVKSLLLLQGAFSHFAFADTLPHDRRRGGHLRGMSARVDGPLVATHSVHDSAVRYAYPLASLVARQDASRFPDPADRWGAMGDSGAREVGARPVLLGSAGTVHSFEPGRWVNADSSHVIRTGGPPSGAHSDIVHPETAWLALAAADLVRGSAGTS